MEKEFYNGQPLIIKESGEKVNFIYDNGCSGSSCSVFKKDRKGCYIEYCDYVQLEPSTEFKFSELMAGLEQGYFDVGTKFRRINSYSVRVLTVKQSYNGLYLEGERELPYLNSECIHSTWVIGDRKEMTLEEIEDELGCKIKLID